MRVLIFSLALVLALTLSIRASGENDLEKTEPEREEIEERVRDPVTYSIEDEEITLYWGEKPTGGYHIQIVDMVFNEGALNVFYTLTYPEPGEPVIMVITYPTATASLPVEEEAVQAVVLVETDHSFPAERDLDTFEPLVLEKEAVTEMEAEKVNIKGRTLRSDVPALLKDGRVLVPARAIAETLEAQVSWNAERYQVTICRGEETVHLFIGDHAFYLNGKKKEMDSAAALYSNRTVVPLRFVAEALGETVFYCAETGEVSIGEERRG